MALIAARVQRSLEQASGVMLIVASGVFSNVNLVGSKLLKSWDWPFFRMMGTGSLCISLTILVAVMATQGMHGLSCQRHQVKWVIARGFFGAAQFVLAVLAALAGAGVGDIGALSSINTVVAALLGRIFLGERLGVPHIIAVALSLLGAVLIAAPWRDAAASGSGGSYAWLGYCLASLSGASFGIMFICARKSGKASTLLLTVSAMTQRGLVLWVLALTGVVDDNSLRRIVAFPWQGVGVLVSLILVTFLGNFSANAGAKRCPAAVGSTVKTATSLCVGYTAQVLIFNEPPTLISFLGAVMMLLAVVTMSIARLPRKKTDDVDVFANVMEAASGMAEMQQETADKSLAAFMASEYAERQAPPDQALPTAVVVTPTVRLRSNSASLTSAKGAGIQNSSFSLAGAIVFGAVVPSISE